MRAVSLNPSTVEALPLQCHPATPCAHPLTLSASLAGAAGKGLQLRFELQGDVQRIRLPEPTRPGPADGLWQHTCFEAFIGVAGEAAYREYNFSPSNQWAAYRFSNQRQRDTAAESRASPVEPVVNLVVAGRLLCLNAWLPLSALPPVQPGQAWDLGLSAVIETVDGQISYWALCHPDARPDFHHRGGWQRLTGLSALLQPPAVP